jgi:hypothetical protein
VGVQERRVAELRKAEREALLDRLTRYPLSYDGHEGYAKVGRPPGALDVAEDRLSSALICVHGYESWLVI